MVLWGGACFGSRSRTLRTKRELSSVKDILEKILTDKEARKPEETEKGAVAQDKFLSLDDDATTD